MYRGPGAIAEQVPGAGLGLAIVEAIAHAHGGTCSVMPNDGPGAMLRLSLPVPPTG